MESVPLRTALSVHFILIIFNSTELRSKIVTGHKTSYFVFICAVVAVDCIVRELDYVFFV